MEADNLLGRYLQDFKDLMEASTRARQEQETESLKRDVVYLEERIGTPLDLGHCTHNLRVVKEKLKILEELIETNKNTPWPIARNNQAIDHE